MQMHGDVVGRMARGAANFANFGIAGYAIGKRTSQEMNIVGVLHCYLLVSRFYDILFSFDFVDSLVTLPHTMTQSLSAIK